MDRVAQLLEFLDEDPADPFNKYALALEYQKSDPKKAFVFFKDLMDNSPSYLPTYYPFAFLLIDLGQSTEAEQVFKQGIETAQKSDNPKALKELRTAYNDWLYTRE